MQWWSYLLANATVVSAIGFVFKLWIEHGRDKKLEEFKATLERKNASWTKLQEQRADAIRAVYGDMTAFMLRFPGMTARLREFKTAGERELQVEEMRKLATTLHHTFLFNAIYFNDKEGATIGRLLTVTKEFEARCYALPSSADQEQEQQRIIEMMDFIKAQVLTAMDGMVNEFQRILGVDELHTMGRSSDKRNGRD